MYQIHLHGKMIHYGTKIAYIYLRNPNSHKMYYWNRPKGLDPMVESEDFFTIGQGSILVRDLPGAMGTP
jgi:hypothetical protein